VGDVEALEEALLDLPQHAAMLAQGVI